MTIQSIYKKLKAWLKNFLRKVIWAIYQHRIRSASHAESDVPHRILVLNGAHLGDVVITTSIIPVLRSAYPNSEIGFLVGSWAAVAIQGHNEIANIHIADHWWHNRSSTNRFSKYFKYRKTRKVALKEIRDIGYDLALCVYPFYLPDFMDLAFEANIPNRIGFDVSLYSSLATVTVNVPQNPFVHQGEIQTEVLKPLALAKEYFLHRRSVLPMSTEKSEIEVCQLLNISKIDDLDYVVIHIGTGDPKREKSRQFWRNLATSLSQEFCVLFTGHGIKEEESILSIIQGLDNCINACNKLSWSGFVAAVRHAEILYGVESMAGHVAAAVGTPCIVTYSGAAGVGRWRPFGEGAIVMSNHLPCAPCKLPWGCETMDCMRDISSDDILKLSWRNARKNKIYI